MTFTVVVGLLALVVGGILLYMWFSGLISFGGLVQNEDGTSVDPDFHYEEGDLSHLDDGTGCELGTELEGTEFDEARV